MSQGAILVVEDDENLRLALVDNLEDEGYAVTAFADGRSALDWMLSGSPDAVVGLVILDVMLPAMDGYVVCSKLREAGCATPVLMLTARNLEDDIVRGFDAGADDYLTKPYRIRELLARVRALLRRSGVSEREELHFGEFAIDPEGRRVVDRGGSEVVLTRTEFDLLAFLVEHRGRALTRHSILEEVWGRGVVVEGRTVDNFISSLKKKLGWNAESGFRIQAIRGVGYRMEIDSADGD